MVKITLGFVRNFVSPEQTALHSSIELVKVTAVRSPLIFRIYINSSTGALFHHTWRGRVFYIVSSESAPLLTLYPNVSGLTAK